MPFLIKSLFAAVLIALSVAFIIPAAPALAQDISVDAILNDPQAPVGGNPKGDVTIVAFLDYNCPFCKKSAPDLEKLVKTDGKIRLVYKDWPILTRPPSMARSWRWPPSIRASTNRCTTP